MLAQAEIDKAIREYVERAGWKTNDDVVRLTYYAGDQREPPTYTCEVKVSAK